MEESLRISGLDAIRTSRIVPSGSEIGVLPQAIEDFHYNALARRLVFRSMWAPHRRQALWAPLDSAFSFGERLSFCSQSRG
jgi:hypothetical protein